MATRNKRVQVALSDEVSQLVDELHELTGQTKSSIISELMDQVAPALQTTLKAIRLLHEQPREAQRLIQNFTNEAVMASAQASLELDAAIESRATKGKRSRKGGFGAKTP